MTPLALTPADAAALAALLRACARPRTPTEAHAIAAWVARLEEASRP